MNGKFLLDTNAIIVLLDGDKTIQTQLKTAVWVNLMDTTLMLRRTYNIKLPDAIIAASALKEDATLISNDAIFTRVLGLSILTF